MPASWRPACDLRHLRLRAQMLADIRLFFAQRLVLEVETPLLCGATGTDPQLDFFSTALHTAPRDRTLFLQTSPEFAMKRLLAAGSGSIYQICKAFRNGESGRLHNPEFTMLEWYRTGFGLRQLMDEVAELLQLLLTPVYGSLEIRRLSYRRLFQDITGLDPLSYDRRKYGRYADGAGLIDAANLCGGDHGLWLDFLFSHAVQPAMVPSCLYLLYDYPAIQSSLARLNPEDPRVTERFELFVGGMELGNGYFELADEEEQERRFDAEIALRSELGRQAVEKDRRLLAALRAGLPDCSGVAIGLDRLLMLIAGSGAIDQVLAFPLENA